MRRLITFLLCTLSIVSIVAQEYHSDDVAALKSFLTQPSGEVDKLNGELLGLTSDNISAMESNDSWVVNVTGVTWDDSTPKRIREIDWGWDWQQAGLAGDLNLSGCAALENLNCSDNELTSLDVSNLTSLSTLRADSSHLSLLDVSGCTSLSVLYCANNQLTTLNVTGNTSLQDLRCTKNQLTTLNVSGCTALGGVDCRDNLLVSLNISNPSLTFLNCQNNLLTNLDISGCTTLEYLACISNKLTDLDVSNNIALTNLACDNNELTILDIHSCIALEHLNCTDNDLTTLDISRNTLLTSLYCHSNKIASLDVSNNTALVDLGCDSNELTSLNISNNTALTYLSCGYNPIRTLNVNNHTALTGLHCRGNQLTTLDVSHNTLLTDLACYDNQLTTLDLSNNTSLEELHCAGNPLTKLTVSWAVPPPVTLPDGNGGTYENFSFPDVSGATLYVPYQTTALYEVADGWKDFGTITESVSLYHEHDKAKLRAFLSQSSTVSGITNGELLGLTSEEMLGWDSSESWIEKISTENGPGVGWNSENPKRITGIGWQVSNLAGSLAGSLDLSGCVALERLIYDGHNQLTALNLAGCAALISLHCTSNPLTELDVSDLTSLLWLNCSNTQLSTLDVSQNRLLTELLLDDCPLTTLDISNNTLLTELAVSGSQLTSLDVSHNTSLTLLRYENNPLSELDVSALTSLTSLFCSGNSLESLDLSHNTALTSLECVSNRLTTLDVSRNTGLRMLNCSNNQLSALDISSLSTLGSLVCGRNLLESLDISHNSALAHLSCESNQLSVLDLSNNPSLTALNCYYNQLSALDVRHNTSLTILQCFSNQLTTLDISSNLLLEYLHFEYNPLTEVTVGWSVPPPATRPNGNGSLYFPDVSAAVLYVPYGTSSLYAAADVWRDFGEITELPSVVTPYLSVTSSDLIFSSVGEILALGISSNVSWSLSSNVNWLSLSVSSGNGDVVVSVSSSSNSSSVSRTGIITLSGIGVPSHSLLVIQRASAITPSVPDVITDGDIELGSTGVESDAVWLSSGGLSAASGARERGHLVAGSYLYDRIESIGSTGELSAESVVQISFSGSLSGLVSPVVVELPERTLFPIPVVYVFESSELVTRVLLRATESSWAEIVDGVMYIHLVNISVSGLSSPTLLGLSIVGEDGSVSEVGVGSKEITLYDHPLHLSIDNGPSLGSVGYFVMSGNYSDSLRYRLENDAVYHVYAGGLSASEISRLASGELLYLVEPGSLDIVIYHPQTYESTNPVPPPTSRRISLAIAEGSTFTLSTFSGITSDESFSFVVTPDEFLPAGEFTFTYTKDGIVVSNPPDVAYSLNADGLSYTVTLSHIKVSDLVVTISYRQSTATNAVPSPIVWSAGSILYISSPISGVAKVYNVAGALVTTITYGADVTSVTSLRAGIYIIVLGDDSRYKTIISK